MENTIVQGIFWFVFSVFLALIEIEIEGNKGWAQELPTWYRKTGIGKIYGLLMNHKPMTGYHTFLQILLLLIFHAHYFQGCAWTLKGELSTIGLIMTVSVVWDYLWFILNPHFTRKNFRPEKIWWHARSKWFLGFPADYYSGIILAVILNIFAHNFRNYLFELGIFIGGTIIVIIISPLYHRFYQKMREKDDRSKD